MPMLVSAIGQHRRPRHIEQIFNTQISACLTKIRNRSVAFVPRHVGATGAQGVSTVESSQCFLVAPRLDVEVLQQCKSSFRISHLYNLRWPAPKRAAEVTTESKKFDTRVQGNNSCEVKSNLHANIGTKCI